MVKIKNIRRQPFVYNLKDGSSLYLFSKQTVELSDSNFLSTEIQSALRNNDIMILQMSEEVEKELEKETK